MHRGHHTTNSRGPPTGTAWGGADHERQQGDTGQVVERHVNGLGEGIGIKHVSGGKIWGMRDAIFSRKAKQQNHQRLTCGKSWPWLRG